MQLILLFHEKKFVCYPTSSIVKSSERTGKNEKTYSLFVVLVAHIIVIPIVISMRKNVCIVRNAIYFTLLVLSPFFILIYCGFCLSCDLLTYITQRQKCLLKKNCREFSIRVIFEPIGNRQTYYRPDLIQPNLNFS